MYRRKVTGLTSGVTGIGVSETNGCAVVNAGVRCWGDNNYGQLGSGVVSQGSTTPVQVIGL